MIEADEPHCNVFHVVVLTLASAALSTSRFDFSRSSVKKPGFLKQLHKPGVEFTITGSGGSRMTDYHDVEATSQLI